MSLPPWFGEPGVERHQLVTGPDSRFGKDGRYRTRTLLALDFARYFWGLLKDFRLW